MRLSVPETAKYKITKTLLFNHRIIHKLLNNNQILVNNTLMFNLIKYKLSTDFRVSEISTKHGFRNFIRWSNS